MKKLLLILCGLFLTLQMSAYYNNYYYVPPAPYMPDNGPMRGPNAHIEYQPNMNQRDSRALNYQHQQQAQARAFQQNQNQIQNQYDTDARYRYQPDR